MKRVAAIFCGCALAAAAMAVALAFVPPVRLPQVVKGGDALSVAFADAKETISAAMVHKADSYFHGGIDMDCHAAHDHDHEHGHDHGHDHDEDRHDHCEPAEETGFDPWRWINLHVRAPEHHVHLDGEKSVEMMPWFWAAVRADPHNVDAWTTAMYVANNMLKDKALARRVIEEAKAKNPYSLEIAFAEARFVYDGGKGDVIAAERILKSALERGKRKCNGRLSELSERDAETCRRIQEYLDGIRKARAGGGRP